MAFNGYYLLSTIAIVSLSLVIFTEANLVASLNRSYFPSDFVFGVASSAYQYEGAANENGKGPSVWDNLTHSHPDKIDDGSNGDVADDSYHRYMEDVSIIKDLNMDAYRFSISWSRILPKGDLSGGINQEGIEYYNKLINELLDKGLQPYATIFHFDLPQALKDKYEGFLSPKIVNDFRDYAELCFEKFGDRVKHWITLNEPFSYSTVNYGNDSSTGPYLVTHYQILAHAAAVDVYKTKYQVNQKGLIGITLNIGWVMPLSNSTADQDAAQRSIDFIYGWNNAIFKGEVQSVNDLVDTIKYKALMWIKGNCKRANMSMFMEPLTSGAYPKTMRSLVGQRLPEFSIEQARLVNGSFDFIGINYYSSNYVIDAPDLKNATPSYFTDALVNITFERHGRPIGPRAASSWLYIYPKGIREILLYTKKKYNNPLIFITENGMDEFNDETLSLKEALIDTYRIDYYYRHLFYLHYAIKDDGVNVKGFFAWSLLDNFEWLDGYTLRFGITFVDYEDGLKRHKKLSALWFKEFLKRN